MSEEKRARPEQAAGEPVLISSRRRGRRVPRIEKRDFRRPAAPAAAQFRELEQVARRLALRLRTALANYLKTAIAHEVAPPVALQYASAVADAPDGTWFVPLHTPAGERAVLFIEQTFQSHLIGRLLGWSGAKKQQEPEEEASAAAERAPLAIGEVSRAALKPFLASLVREVNHVLREGEARDPFEVDEARRRLAAHNMLRGADNVFRFGVRLSEGTEGGCLGLLVLRRTVAPLLSVQGEAPAPAPEPQARARLERVVRGFGITLSASLGQATVGLAEFLSLEPGNVLVLDRKVREPLEVQVGSLARFSAQPGRSGGQLAVRILACMDHKESP
ncbi:MAG: FliM/FliN family flagellar motor switch protein [Planctomycetes bacterium]|nr:FliM/FliN family flagellar motor switch protein [Planctomycetota bacterium]